MSASGRVLELTRSLHESVARMERSAIRGRRAWMERSRISLRSIRATSLHPARSRLEEAVRGILRRALLRYGLLQPFDFRIHQRNALGQFLDRQQRQVLADLVGDFLARLVVILDGHAFLLALGGSRSGCQPEPGWLIRGGLQILSVSQGQIMEKLPAQMTVVGISKPGGPEVLLP